MKASVLFVVAMFAGTLALAQAGGGVSDSKKMEGTWQGMVLEIGGKAPSDGEKKISIKLLIKGDRYTIFFDEQKTSEGAFKLDEKKKPKTIDATASEGDFKGKVQPGIYQFEGDELKVVFTEPGKERPKEFKTREKTEEVLIRYQRKKAGK